VHRPTSILLFLAAAGCSAPSLSEGSGEGLFAFDRRPPEGAAVWERPQWLAGDRFVYRRGDHITVALRVVEAGSDGYALTEEATGLRLLLTPDLAETERRSPIDPSLQRVKAPANFELSWPLWVGKRWGCHYLDKKPGVEPEPLRVLHHCEAEETIETSFGAKLRCLRIVRTERLEIPGRQFLSRCVVLHYSPEIGWFARRIEDSVLTEIESWHRQGGGAGLPAVKKP
jgi:hypothetical protein